MKVDGKERVCLGVGKNSALYCNNGIPATTNMGFDREGTIPRARTPAERRRRAPRRDSVRGHVGMGCGDGPMLVCKDCWTNPANKTYEKAILRSPMTPPRTGQLRLTFVVVVDDNHHARRSQRHLNLKMVDQY